MSKWDGVRWDRGPLEDKCRENVRLVLRVESSVRCGAGGSLLVVFPKRLDCSLCPRDARASHSAGVVDTGAEVIWRESQRMQGICWRQGQDVSGPLPTSVLVLCAEGKDRSVRRSRGERPGVLWLGELGEVGAFGLPCSNFVGM